MCINKHENLKSQLVSNAARDKLTEAVFLFQLEFKPKPDVVAGAVVIVAAAAESPPHIITEQSPTAARVANIRRLPRSGGRI